MKAFIENGRIVIELGTLVVSEKWVRAGDTIEDARKIVEDQLFAIPDTKNTAIREIYETTGPISVFHQTTNEAAA